MPVAAGPGPLLREWRSRRRLSQLDLAGIAEVSTRHLSYVETGRSTPSRELLLHLARHLEVPRREQNQLLLAAGYAPSHSEFDLADSEMAAVRETLAVVLAGSEPNPTLVMDRHWDLVMANDAALALAGSVGEVPPEVMSNVVRLTLHPAGLAPAIDNLAEVAGHLIDRLRRQFAITGDPVTADLLAEATSLVPDADAARPITGGPMLPVRLRSAGRMRTFVSIVSTFGAAIDVTTSELVIETFYDVAADTAG